MEHHSVIVVGGGFVGLCVARELNEKGHEVLILDRKGKIGGIINDYLPTGNGYAGFFNLLLSTDKRTRALLEWLNLDDRISWHPSTIGFFDGIFTQPLSNLKDYWKLQSLDFVDRVRLIRGLTKIRKLPPSELLEKQKGDAFLSLYFSSSLLDKFVRPFFKTWTQVNYQDISAEYIRAFVHQMFNQTPQGWELPDVGMSLNGLRHMTQFFLTKLREQSVACLNVSNIKEISRKDGKLHLYAEMESYTADNVVLACDNHQIAEICRSLQPEERRALAATRYQSMYLMMFELDCSVGEQVFVVAKEKYFATGAMINLSAVVDTGDRYLVCLPAFTDARDPVVNEPDEEVVHSFRLALKLYCPHISDLNIIREKLLRFEDCIPLKSVRNSASKATITTSDPGIFVVNSTMLPDAIPTFESCLKLAEKACTQISEEIWNKQLPPTEHHVPVSAIGDSEVIKG